MLQIGQKLIDMGHEVQYFGMHDGLNTVGNCLGLETKSMDFRSGGADRLLYPFRVIYSCEAKRKIYRLVRQFKPDIVHLNNIYYHLTPSIIDGIDGCGVPMVQTVHDFQMVCPNHMLMNPLDMRLCNCCIEGSKWNCVRRKCIHGSRVKSFLGSMEGTLYKRLRTYDKINLFICPSRFMEQTLLRDSRFVGKTMTIHNFIQQEEKPDECRKKENYVLYFGRLSEEKGIDRFLDACRLLPEIPFVVAGGGPLEYMLHENCPENVRYVGFQSGLELKKLIAEARFSVYLPVWYENCPLSVLESQALGTPVLANRIGGIPELIHDGETGILIDTFTPEHYAKQIRDLYYNEKFLDQMANNCKERKDFITIDDYCEKLISLYESVMERRI